MPPREGSMTGHIGRREFITLLGGAAASWPHAARARQPQPMPVIGVLTSRASDDTPQLLAAFRQGLKDTGFIEGQNVRIEYRFAGNQNERLPALAADLVHRQVALIAATTTPAALAAKAATTTIPIVFELGADPVQLGLVPSLNRPGGNVTGVSFLADVLGAKRLELLRQLVPTATTVAMLVSPESPNTEAERSDVQAAAQAIGQQLVILDVRSDREIETAFATLVQRRAGALLCGAGAPLNSHRERIVALAARHGVPAIYNLREL